MPRWPRSRSKPATGVSARARDAAHAHGDVRTPAFVPLATKATVKGLLAEEVAALGYDMVLGNTFHLLLSPGPELIERLGGLGPFMGWERPTITDSGGFQVFSMGHGTVADEIKARPSGSGRPSRSGRGAGESGAILAIEEEGVRFRSYVDGRERFLSPEGSMAVQAALRSDIALVFDECTPFHVDRDYTERSTERTHRWLARCLAWHAEHGPPGQLVYGIVQGGVYEDLRRASARAVAASGCDGVADRRLPGGGQGSRCTRWSATPPASLAGTREALPRHLLGIGEVDDLIAGVELGIDTFDCAMPTRLGRHGTALVPDPANRWRLDLVKGRWRESEEPLHGGLPLPCLRAGPLARLPLLPRARRRAHRAAPADPPQPRVPRPPDGRPARRDPRRAPPRGRRRAAGRGGAGGAALAFHPK